ncbi:tetratricopeptide repeat protein [Kitasatospora sp. NPDC048540]|uniref:tetratricopeptide repeat protein n=1 Tax=Kitasatospora sp. NPDC048540 TaxID=3155634 RepID=UPI0033D4BD86
MPLAAFAVQLAEAHHRLDTLSREDRTVRAAFDLSYQRLRPEQARLFRLLALNAGPDVSTEAAGRLADAVADRWLESLARAHLIEAPRWGRWRFHDLVRIYAEELAAADAGEDLAEAEQRLNAYYVETAAAAALNLNDLVALSNDGPLSRYVGSLDGGIAWLDDEYANLLATTVRAQAAGHQGLSAVMPTVVGGYLRLRRVLPQWTAILQRSVSDSAALGDAELTGVVLDLLGLALQEEGRLAEAEAAARRAAKCFRKAREKFRENVALGHLGRALARQGRYEEAVEILRPAVDRLAGEGGRMPSRAHALKDLGEVLLQLGRYQEAAEFSAEAANCFWQPIGDEISEAEARLTEGTALLALGDPLMSTVAFQRAGELFRPPEILVGLAATLNGYGCALWQLGHRDRAVELLREAVGLAEEAGDAGLRADVVGNLAEAYTVLGLTDEAARLAPPHPPHPAPALPRPPGAPASAPAEGTGWWRRRGWPSRRR